jgi:hypothetical protein
VIAVSWYRANQNYNSTAILAEVDAVAGTKVDLVFEDAGTNAFDLGEIPLFDTRKRDGHLGGSQRVEPFEPLGEAFVSALVNVAPEFDHPQTMVTTVLPFVNVRTLTPRRRRPRPRHRNRS